MVASLVLDSDADAEIDATGFSALGVCDCVLDMGGLSDAATMGSFITPAQISFSMIAQSPLSMTRARHLWSSRTALQNVSGGAQDCMAHHTAEEQCPVQWSLPFALLSNPR